MTTDDQGTLDKVDEILTALVTNVIFNGQERDADSAIAKDKKYKAQAKSAITTIIREAEKRAIDKSIAYIRSGEVAGSFSEGCDCEKCDKYEKKVRATLTSEPREREDV